MKNFYVIHGTIKVTDRIQNELEKLIEKIKKTEKIGEDGIVHYDITDENLLDAIEDASTVSMFSNKKIIVMENCLFLSSKKTIDNLEKLEQYIENYNKDSYCILTAPIENLDSKKKICKLLTENAQIISVKEEKKYDSAYITNYVREYLEKYQYQIEDISYLLRKTGKNINNIQNELDKLMIYKKDSKKITKQDIDKVTVSTLEQEDFELMNSIVSKNLTRSMQLLEQALSKRGSEVTEIGIILQLAKQFRFLLQVKRLASKNKTRNEIASILEVKNPKRIDFTLETLYNYTEPELRECIKQLAKIDHDIKLGIMDKRLALELFIIKNCSKEDSY